MGLVPPVANRDLFELSFPGIKPTISWLKTEEKSPVDHRVIPDFGNVRGQVTSEFIRNPSALSCLQIVAAARMLPPLGSSRRCFLPYALVAARVQVVPAVGFTTTLRGREITMAGRSDCSQVIALRPKLDNLAAIAF